MNRTRDSYSKRALKASLLASACMLPDAALAALAPIAHGQVIRDFARITFEWPQPVEFKASAEDKTVILTFDKEAAVDFTAVLKNLKPYVRKAENAPDGRSVVLTLKKPYRIRTFNSARISGVDLLEVGGKPAPIRKKRIKPMVVSKNEGASKVASTHPNAARFAALAPAAGEAQAEPQPDETQTAQNVAQDAAQTQSLAEAAPTERENETSETTQQAAKEENEAAKTDASQETVATQNTQALPIAEVPVPLSYGKQDQVASNGFVKVGLSSMQDSAVLRFPFTERMAIASFIRGRNLWVVFNKPLKMDVSDFKTAEKTVVSNPQIIPSAKATIMRFDVEESVNVSVTKETSSYNWGILLTASVRGLKQSLRPAMRTDANIPPHIFIPALEMADTVNIYDPQVGDEMVVMPLFGESVGLAAKNDFVDFTLLQTGQGVAVVKKADDVKVTALRNGLRVTATGKDVLTPGLTFIDRKGEAEALQQVATLFPYHGWKTQNINNAEPELNALFIRTVKETNLENTEASNEARLNMAKIYLGAGLAVESLGMLDIIREKDPAFYRTQKLAALRGAANFLMYRYADAARDFASGELDNNKEMDFWRKLVADLLGSQEQTYDYLALDENYISKYPPEMRRRVMIVAADRAIFDREYNTALKIIETVEDEEVLRPALSYVKFLKASIAAGTGQETEAIESWDELAENYEEPFIRASAELSRIVWGISNEELTTQDAVERLERLRLSWHGDRLELQVIERLGEIYENQKDYVNAMRIWHGGITSFPNSALAVEMKSKMQEAFDIMFAQGRVDELPPLDVLAMYYEYRAYAPTGATGGEIIEKLADRLVSVDLLKQAAELLDSQMRFVAEKEQRSRLGARLARIHLLNRKPEMALGALQDSLYGENSLLLKLERNRLAAEAMVDQGRYESALQVLGQDTTQEASKIRLEVFWNQRRWEQVITTVEALLKEREKADAQVTLDESEALLKLALAYVFEDNRIQLKYLRDYFLPLMENNPYRESFDFVTRSDMEITTRNFDEIIQNLSDTREFISAYRTRIELTEQQSSIE